MFPSFKSILFVCLLAIAAMNAPARPDAIAPTHQKPKMYKALQQYIQQLLPTFETIEAERKAELKELATTVNAVLQQGRPAKLVFICTHNSRRSHFAQIWATTAAYWYKLPNVSAYSGGTEESAFNPRAIAALERAGFVIEQPTGNNPRCLVSYAAKMHPMTCFSKKIDHPENPNQDFIAVMNCSEADQACPLVPGAEYRMALSYQDPKSSDGTPQEASTYDERCRQIAQEIFYLFSLIAA